MNNSRYNSLFSTEDKAAAFDKIAEKYFNKNFGTLQKADFEVLLFSIYINRILDKGEENVIDYSDYTLAKELGIAQTRIKNLKVKKQLQYPRENFNWRESFIKLWENARYENGKIKIYIPDVNLFNEIQNAIEENGGFIEKQLNPKLLQVSPEYFVDVLLLSSEESDRKTLRKEIKSIITKNGGDTEYFDKEPIGALLKNKGVEAIVDLLADVLLPNKLSPLVSAGINSIISKMKRGK